MARIQHSIEIHVPVQTLYDQLTQFKEYPAFWENIENVKQVDDIHVHWRAKTGNSLTEWDTEIIDQKPDECIVWHNINEANDVVRIEVQALNQYISKAVFTLDAEPGQAFGLVAGETPEKMSQCLTQSLENLKVFMETLGLETGAWRGRIEDGNVTMRGRDAQDKVQQTAGQRSPASFSDPVMDVPGDAGPDRKTFSDKPSGKTQGGLSR